jgi:hypothetical protein
LKGASQITRIVELSSQKSLLPHSYTSIHGSFCTLGPIAQLGERGTEDIHLPRSGVRSTFGPSFCVNVFLLGNVPLGRTAKQVVQVLMLGPSYTQDPSCFACCSRGGVVNILS